MVCNMNLDVPFTMEDHLTLNALVCLLLKKKKTVEKKKNKLQMESRNEIKYDYPRIYLTHTVLRTGASHTANWCTKWWHQTDMRERKSLYKTLIIIQCKLHI